ncbi:hypothetical protein FAES_2833 [Fibrella aestuarina BUZ 2]|uniref:Uncharacterized protein n=1 Tax=Fibrella aestuarina BUZ 2 TaxID=1166018 RepID=I0K9N9_9BACT|nr:hypothetical protein FAES_2833 [Fibrella aestuarina BUZ 2]
MLSGADKKEVGGCFVNNPHYVEHLVLMYDGLSTK